MRPEDGHVNHEILAIVPAFNEAATVEQVVNALREQSEITCLVVDDGSTDGTGDLARHAGASVVSFPTNLGIGTALRAGFMFASRRGFRAAFQFDADGQHDAGSIEDILSPVLEGDADLVIGSRFRGTVDYRVSRVRRTAMHMVGLIVRSVTRLQLTDPTSGFRAFSRDAIELFSRNYPTDYMDNFEAIVIAHHASLRVAEVPVAMWARNHGRPSTGGLSAGWHTLRAMLSVYIAHWQPVRSRESRE